MRLPRAYRPSTVGHAIGRRRADRSGSGVAPAQIGREAGIWDRDSLLAGVASWWFLVGSATNGDVQPQGKRGKREGIGRRGGEMKQGH